jgi:FHA domain/von Willebrand factor type A domain
MMTMRTFVRTSVFAAVALGMSAGAAQATVTVKGAPETIKVDPNYKPKEDELQPLPHLRVKLGTTLVGLKAIDFTVSTDKDGKIVSVPGEKAIPFKDSNEELDLLILVQGSLRFMGDPTPEANAGEEATPINGYYNEVKAAIDTIAKARPKNTNIALYMYGDKTKILADWTPASNFTAESLGVQKDFAKITTKAFIKGLDFANTALQGKNGRRVLFVIGDGDDQDQSAKINDSITKLQNASIEVYVLGANPQGNIEPVPEGRLNKLGKLGEAQKALQAEQIPQVADTLANAINNVYTVDFAQRASDTQTLPWDGQEHELTFAAKKDTSDPFTFNLMNIVPVAVAAGKDWTWLYVLLAVLGLAIVGIVVAMVLRKPKVEEEAYEEPPPPPPVMEMPMPMAAPKQKTMMIGVGGETDGMPVVGWIVPLSGPAQYQTFKLSSRTVIGTAQDANVVIPDPFMSGQHAEILMSPGGFTLMDKGSANGLLVNAKRVPTHELVDNDVFTLGKTDFKFKSIN